jgi:hypothetical protein
MTYQTSHHSGDSWRTTRVLAAHGDVRIDGRISNTGAFAYTIDGPAGSWALDVTKSFDGQLCDPGTAACVPVSKDAGERLEVAFRYGRLLTGQTR